MKYPISNIRALVIRAPFVSLSITGLLFLWLGFLIQSPLKSVTDQSSNPSVRLSQKEYPLINPLLLCGVEQKGLNEDKTLSQLIQNFTDARTAQKDADLISAYVYNYKTGLWSAANENERYDPASMLKVPLMIAYYHAAEKNPSILNRQLAFNGDDQNTDEYYKSPNDIKPNKFYTVDQLINSMIINSDNTAAVMLQKNIDQSLLTDVYTDIGLPVPPETPNVEYLSAKLYAYFLRILYNATYLDRTYSEKALELLAEPDIPGIRQGVPRGITVAQKFGERTVYNSHNVVIERELHDCGIVYKSEAPYLLCIMSRGKDFDLLDKNISDLSALIYKEIH